MPPRLPCSCLQPRPRRLRPGTPPALQPEQIRQCLQDYASINVWQLEGEDTDAPSITLGA